MGKIKGLLNYRTNEQYDTKTLTQHLDMETTDKGRRLYPSVIRKTEQCYLAYRSLKMSFDQGRVERWHCELKMPL